MPWPGHVIKLLDQIQSVDSCCVYSQIATLYLRTSGGSPVTKPTQWWQMTIVPHWDYRLMPIRQSELELEVLLEYLLSLRRNLTTNNAALDSLRQPCCISKRVRDLTRRLKGHKIEHQHRYRRSRKRLTGCGGLRALYMLMMFVAMQRHGHSGAVHLVCGGSSPPISIDVVIKFN